MQSIRSSIHWRRLALCDFKNYIALSPQFHLNGGDYDFGFDFVVLFFPFILERRVASVTRSIDLEILLDLFDATLKLTINSFYSAISPIFIEYSASQSSVESISLVTSHHRQTNSDSAHSSPLRNSLPMEKISTQMHLVLRGV